MGLEIERKFLVEDSSYKAVAVRHTDIVQGYLSRVPERTVRVRTAGGEGRLTVKGKNRGMVREEYEYSVPYADATGMLGLCEKPLLEKTRWIVPYGGYEWEVDEYHGAREGLCLAEVELPDEGVEPPLPVFVGPEVTGNPAYYNSQL